MSRVQVERSGPEKSNGGVSWKGASPDTVVLVHGLAAHKLAMWPLANYLVRRGFSVINWGYPSILPPIEHHARRLAELLESLESRPDEARYHLVTHSMGSIIARTALAQIAPAQVAPAQIAPAQIERTSESAADVPESLNRLPGVQRLRHVVMLGPPNHGSPVARVLAPYLGWLCPPLHQLTDEASSYVNCLELPRCGQWGIVAAERDYVVPLRSTCLQPEADHIVVPGRHTGILFARRTAEEVAHFLENGSFRPEAKRIDSSAWIPDGSSATSDGKLPCTSS